MGHLVALQLHTRQVTQLAEDRAVQCANLVVVQVYVSQAGEEGLLLDEADIVEAHVEGLEAELAAQVVVIADLVDPIVVHVQPLQRLGDEGEVKPLEVVGRHVEPFEVLQRGHKPVHVLELVVVEAQRTEVLEVLHSLLFDGCDAVVGQVENVQVCVVSEHLTGDLGQPVARQPEAVEVGEAADLSIGRLGDPVLAQVQGPQVHQTGQGFGDLRREQSCCVHGTSTRAVM
jgi:hypothetical protein